MTRAQRIASWAMQVAAAAILAQTLFFKFTGAEESIYIFEKVGMEPWGRLGSGVAELVAAVLLLTPRWVAFGALLGGGVVAGAVASHLTVLGIEVKGDGGLLFGLALAVLACCAGIGYIRRRGLLAAWAHLARLVRGHGGGTGMEQA